MEDTTRFISVADAAAHLSEDASTRDRVKALLNAYNEGYHAFLVGLDETQNPYEIETDAYLYWEDGYSEASRILEE